VLDHADAGVHGRKVKGLRLHLSKHWQSLSMKEEINNIQIRNQVTARLSLTVIKAKQVLF
jgi:hypothetical protein